jgi:hypothetical protein
VGSNRVRRTVATALLRAACPKTIGLIAIDHKWFKGVEMFGSYSALWRIKLVAGFLVAFTLAASVGMILFVIGR